MNYDQAGTSTWATGMDVDQDPREQETPLSTPFNDGFTPSTTRGNTLADPTGGVHTENFFSPLYTESQDTNHTNVNTNQRTPAPIRTRIEAIRDAEVAAAAAAAAAEAEASAAATAVDMEAAAEMETDAAASGAAEIVARLAAVTKVAAAAEVVAATTASVTKAEVAAAAAVADATGLRPRLPMRPRRKQLQKLLTIPWHNRQRPNTPSKPQPMRQ